YGLKGPHSVYLLVLGRHPEGLTATQMCELCAKDKADVSRMISIMEKKGLVYRSNQKSGVYRGVFCLTEEGKTVAKEVRERSGIAVLMAGRDMTDVQRASMYEALDSITANLRQLSEDGLPDKLPATERKEAEE
ncbi:MAG: MarR family transcriptional regulator, partial [Clostridia bacterium]|nr:MarR family transcriptional regulator [Clostridia bacterium]